MSIATRTIVRRLFVNSGVNQAPLGAWTVERSEDAEGKRVGQACPNCFKGMITSFFKSLER
jgi:hypothetical protein